jgi:hypothetical protein
MILWFLMDNTMESENFVNSKLCYFVVDLSKYTIKVLKFYSDCL